MCGRYTFSPDPSQLEDLFPDLEVPADLEPRYNISPTQTVPAVLNDGHQRIDLVRWGLIPSWAKDPAIGNRLINARSETLAEKPSFRAAFKRRRCLILTSGFYEWQKVPGQRQKAPHHIRMKSGDPFAFAGLWEIWRSPEDDRVLSCTIITTTPNDVLSPIHHRMPVILDPRDYAAWLQEGEAPREAMSALLKPYPPAAMEAYPISMLVNNPRNDSPECIEPLAAG